MAMMPESKITAAIIRKLKTVPESFVMKLHGSMYQVAGLPDILFLYSGIAFFIEVKTPGGRTTPIQQHMHRRLVNAGCQVQVCTSVLEACRFVASAFEPLAKFLL